MGSHMNFNGFGDAPLGESGSGGGSGKPIGNNNMLARQSSVYSLTFDEFQNTIGGGYGKDFGSMNMDELLKNIWTAEETQILSASVGMGGGNGVGVGAGGSGSGGGVNMNGNIQRQGSITLPRTLSQMTVDEVWRDLFKDSDNGAKVGGSGSNGTTSVGEANMPQRQQTLGEMTLEEFLVRAGIVREDAHEIGRPSINNGSNNHANANANANANALAFGFQQPSRNNGLVDNRMPTMTNPTTNRPLNLPMNNGGVRSSQQVQMQQQQQQQLQQQQLKSQQQQQQQQPLYPKPATLAFTPPMHLVSNAQLTSPATRETIVGVNEPAVSSALVQARGLQQGRGGINSMANVGAATGTVTVGTRSPANHISSNVVAKASAVDSPSVSPPVPYMFSRGGKCGPGLEKVIERRHRRMIKNRESAARSRARKQFNMYAGCLEWQLFLHESRF
ncbi:ABSCISIC ACID-INSENSITIVE 5-like protein 7 isoform X2 [Cannabis sativa]|uniref:ABSCISIC ACID-INSENSITIVE 5-like protein 7 isoform X2 n=1 Tax=Cannabis sativa TaxID=3483 RepID=UPI0029C9C3E4|nr:ABSCISIC ACID-INSENSITIVE 5-like protein 7 isoform X2 [Cannabis sativa]